MAENKRIRVMVADDDVTIRKMLETLFEVTTDMELVAQARQGAEAIRDYVLNQPDVALINIRMPLMDGLEAIRTIRRLVPEARLIVYSANAGRLPTKQILQTGAVGFLEKTAPIATILGAIRNVYAGLRMDGKPLEGGEQ